ncbi:MAG: hypothetical protein AB7S26_21820 [Sandaracinaceae bacterium]
MLAACGAPVAASSAADVVSDEPTLEPARVAATWWPRLVDGLRGEWTATTASGGTLTVRYRVVSRGSALVQTWAPGTPGETITVVHPDGEAISLTHYCGQGNQARLVAVEASADRIVFRRYAVTNATDEQSVLSELALDLAADGASYAHVETYTDAHGESETTRLEFHRAASAHEDGS